MSSAILSILDQMGKSISRLRNAIKKGDLKLTKARYENLVDFSDCIQSLLPKEFVEKAFRGFNSHLSYLGHFIGKRFFDYIESNFNDLADIDFPALKPEVYSYLEKSQAPERRHAASKNVFIVHGRDHTPVKELKGILSGFGLNPIVLHEQPGGSRTIVEKLEKYSDVGYAFILLTPDDAGYYQYEKRTLSEDYAKKMLLTLQRLRTLVKKEHELDVAAAMTGFVNVLRGRARQNVVFEFGYFVGLLGRDRVCCLHEGDLELPSDMHGIVYIPFKKSVNEVKDKIVKELKATGYEIRA